MARTKRPEMSKGTPPPSKKAKVSKSSASPKFRTKVQSSKPRPKRKGIVIQEPSLSQPSTKSVHSGKGKEKAVSRDADIQAKKFMESLDTAFKRFTSQSQGKSQNTSQEGSASGASGSASTTSQMVKEAQASVPPPNFITDELKVSDTAVFKREYGSRSFCPIVYVDLEKLKSECNIDLPKFLGQFTPLLKIRIVYAPSVVKVFYFNMRIEDLTDQDGNIVEEGLTTTIRGKSLRLTADLLNTLLGIENAPSGPFKEFTDVEIFSLLKPGEPLGPLSFSPGSMKDEFRLVWYIYSRCLVNKGKNFSHFTGKDYPLMASIISQEPRNLGKWILDEMKQFRFHSTVTSTIPFPSLISYILFLHNVWYLVEEEKPVAIERFGQVHLSRMKISFKEATPAKSKPLKDKDSRMEAPPSQSRADEAQSSQAGSPSSAPSFFKASIQSQLQEAVQSAMQSSHESLLQKIDLSQELFLGRIQQFHEDLINKVDSQIKKVVEGLNKNFNMLSDSIQGQAARLDNLEHLLSTFMNPSPSSDPSPPPSTTTPTSVPSDPFPTFHGLPTESGSLHTEPTFTPHHHSTSSSSDTTSPTFDPMSALVVYSPPSSSFTFPTLFPDDKGEKNS